MAASAVLKGQNHQSATHAAPLTISVSSVTAGDGLVLCIALDIALTGGTITLDGVTLTTTALGIYTTGGTGAQAVMIGYRLSLSSGSHSFVITPASGDSTVISWWVYEVTNVASFDVDGGEPWNAVSSASLVLPVINATGAGIAFYVVLCTNTFIPPGSGGWQAQTAQNGNGSGYLVHTGGTITPAFTQSPSATYIALNASFLATSGDTTAAGKWSIF